MRLREIIPESWWKDLDQGFLSMMGYSKETQEPEQDSTDLVSSIASDAKAIRQSR